MKQQVPIEVIERTVSQNLKDFVSALKRISSDNRAGMIPCAGGVAAFTGVDSPLTTIKGAGPEIADSDIDEAIFFFDRNGEQSAKFELAPWVTDSSRKRLAARGFEEVGVEDVVVCQLPVAVPESRFTIAPMEVTPWARLVATSAGLQDDASLFEVLQAAALLPDAVNLGVLDEGSTWISSAQIVPVNGVAIFGCDGTLPSARGRGAQSATIHERLRRAANSGYSWAIAEVEPGSTSERNYLRCGFHVAYGRTCYRLNRARQL